MSIETNTDNGISTASSTSTLLSSGTPCDRMGAAPGQTHISGSSFTINKANARIKVKLTVDDRGELILHHQESGQDYTFTASLPDGQWTQLDDSGYWQTNAECNLPSGHYTVGGYVENTCTQHAQNRVLLRYEVHLVADDDSGEPEPEPEVPADEPEVEPQVCCDCGGCTEKDGDDKVIATIDLPGESFVDRCFLKSQFEELQQQTAAVGGEEGCSTTVITGGLKNWLMVPSLIRR